MRRRRYQLGVQLPPRGSRRRKMLVVSAGIVAFALTATLLISSPGGIARRLPVVPGINPLYVQLAAKWAAYYEVPLQWVLATILAESGGNPNSVGDYHIDPQGASIGLMQVNAVAHRDELAREGLTRDSLFNPDTNIKWGTMILAKCIQRAQSAWGGRGAASDVGLLARLCYTGAVRSGTDTSSCPSCTTTANNWNARLRQTSAAA